MPERYILVQDESVNYGNPFLVDEATANLLYADRQLGAYVLESRLREVEAEMLDMAQQAKWILAERDAWKEDAFVQGCLRQDLHDSQDAKLRAKFDALVPLAVAALQSWDYAQGKLTDPAIEVPTLTLTKEQVEQARTILAQETA